jgi:hypothetical protein
MRTLATSSFGCWDYDRMRALADGPVRVEGVDLNYIPMEMPESFHRAFRNAASDAFEMSARGVSTSASCPSQSIRPAAASHGRVTEVTRRRARCNPLTIEKRARAAYRRLAPRGACRQPGGRHPAAHRADGVVPHPNSSRFT